MTCLNVGSRLLVVTVGLMGLLGYLPSESAQPSKGRNPSPAAPISAPWDEPSTFLGLDLGKPIADQSSVIVRCPVKPLMPGSTITTRDYSFKSFCYHPFEFSSSFADVDNGPSIGVGYNMTLILDEGIFQGAILNMSRFSKDQFLDLLKSRYGEPHKIRRTSYQNRMGATYEGNVYSWSGPKVLMQFSEYGSTLDESSFEIVTRAYEKMKSERSKARAENNKGKL